MTMFAGKEQGRVLVSVVVIGRNEGERLRVCLASIQRMDRAGFEIELIYVDSGSTDGSVALAAGMGARTIALDAERPSAALGRNAGWRAARGSFILFLDGDTVLHERFVAEGLPHFEAAEIAVVWGHRRELYPTHSVYNRVLDLDWIYAPGLTPFCGGDALFRTEALRSAGGFDETLIAGEEPELCRRMLALGFRILHIDQPMTGHDMAMTHWAQYWKRAMRAGHAYAEVSERFAYTGDPFWSAEVRRNKVRAVSLMTLVGTGVAGAMLLRAVWPMVLLLVMLSVLCLRTAWKARWKTADKVALVLYGIHSHLQQIPIFWGQMQYRESRKRGVRVKLVEYKRP